MSLVYVSMFFLFTVVQNYKKKSNEFFQSYDHKCTATFFYETQCSIVSYHIISRNICYGANQAELSSASHN